MMTTFPFNPEALQSPTSLAQFLDGAVDLQAIRSSTSSNWIDRWEIDNWSEVKEAYHSIHAFLLTVYSYLLHGLGCYSLSKRVWVMSCHEQSAGTIIKIQKIFQSNLLAPSINAHRLDSASFYLQPSMQIHLPGQSQEIHIDFFQDWVCRGMCHWFVFLFFQSQGQGLSLQDQLRAIGQRFSQGASFQAAFLQSIPEVRMLYDLLPLKLQENALSFDPGTSLSQIVKEIQQCPIGIYGIYANKHQMIYINGGGQGRFLFDPNKGVLKVDSFDLFKRATEIYFKNHHLQWGIFLDRYTPRLP